MKIKSFQLWFTILTFLAQIAGAEEATTTEVTIWAPGMEEPQVVNPRNGELQIELGGSYYAYVIKGISGDISLGSESEEGDFYTLNEPECFGLGGAEILGERGFGGEWTRFHRRGCIFFGERGRAWLKQ